MDESDDEPMCVDGVVVPGDERVFGLNCMSSSSLDCISLMVASNSGSRKVLDFVVVAVVVSVGTVGVRVLETIFAGAALFFFLCLAGLPSFCD